MSIVMPSHHGPPTPPIREPYSLRQGSLRGHPGSNLQFQHDYLDDSSFMTSTANSTYKSPRSRQTVMDDFGAPYTHLGQGEQGKFQYYDGYGKPIQTFQDSMYQSPIQHQYPNPALHGTLMRADIVDSSGRTSRQARRLIPNPYSRSPSPPRRRKAKKDNSKKSKLDKPLSELTRHLENIPIKDTETWVNRSAEQRQKEVGSGGFIKRPSNSFILYRSAYADRCREYEKSNNHQDISSMAGASWAIEAPEVRKQYENWAKIERENHQAAFPDYKFQPQTQEAKARKRKGKMDDESLDDSDLDDPTYHGGRGATPGSARSIRSKKQRRSFRESSYTPSVGSDGEWGTPEPYPIAMQNQSYYGRANPGKPMPAVLNGMGPGGYYHATSYPNARFSNVGHVEDVVFQHQELPPSLYDTAPPVGLPGASHEDLMGEIQDNGHLMFSSSSLDPDLLAYDQTSAGQADLQGLSTGAFQASEYLGDEHGDFGQEIGQGKEEWSHFDD